MIFVVSLLATIRYASFPEVAWNILDGHTTARLMLAFSGTIIAVLCVWGVEYRREQKKTPKGG